MSLQPMLERVNSGVEEETVFSTSAISEKEAVSLIGKDCVFSLDFRVGMKIVGINLATKESIPFSFALGQRD